MFFFLNFYLFIYLFIFSCVASSLLCVGFSLVAASGGYSVAVRGLLIAVASRCGARALGTWALVVAARRLSSCGTRA